MYYCSMSILILSALFLLYSAFAITYLPTFCSVMVVEDIEVCVMMSCSLCVRVPLIIELHKQLSPLLFYGVIMHC